MSDGNRLLMSDSLKGVVPELEDDMLKQMEDTLIVSSFHFVLDEASEVLSASMLGCVVEEDVVKVDFQLDTSDAYRWFSSFSKKKWACTLLVLSHSGQLLELPGPFRVKNPRLSDVDRKTRVSAIGIDLFRD